MFVTHTRSHIKCHGLSAHWLLRFSSSPLLTCLFNLLGTSVMSLSYSLHQQRPVRLFVWFLMLDWEEAQRKALCSRLSLHDRLTLSRVFCPVVDSVGGAIKSRSDRFLSLQGWAVWFFFGDPSRHQSIQARCRILRCTASSGAERSSVSLTGVQASDRASFNAWLKLCSFLFLLSRPDY